MVTLLQPQAVASYRSEASTEPCKAKSVSVSQPCREWSQTYVPGTTGGAEDRKQGCQQTILNRHSKPQSSGGRMHFLANHHLMDFASRRKTEENNVTPSCFNLEQQVAQIMKCRTKCIFC